MLGFVNYTQPTFTPLTVQDIPKPDRYQHQRAIALADLSYFNLKGCNFVGANLKGTNLSYSCLELAKLVVANLQGANLYRANLRKAKLVGAVLKNCFWEEADLTHATLE